jgi:hypothetical protein
MFDRFIVALAAYGDNGDIVVINVVMVEKIAVKACFKTLF